LLGWAILRAPLPGPDDLLWITPAACCFVVGYLAFFNGLRVGAISLVSPISSAGAAVPVLAGIGFFGEAASGARLGGIGLTLIGICVLMADPGAIGALAPEGRRQGIRAGVVTLLAWGSGTALLLPAVRSAGAFVPVATLRLEVLAIISAWWLINRARSSSLREPVSSPASENAAMEAGPWWCQPPSRPDGLLRLRCRPSRRASRGCGANRLRLSLGDDSIARHRLQERLAGREWLRVGLTLAGVGLPEPVVARRPEVPQAGRPVG
jgi:multidrug transporter EmrE-like cation transporter